MKIYISNNFKPLFLAVAFSTIASILAVRVQFLKGDVLDFALTSSFKRTLQTGTFLGLLIVMEIAFHHFYDRNKGKFSVESIKEIKRDYFKALLLKDYPDFLKRPQGEYLAQYTNEIGIVENQYFSTLPMLFEITIKIAIVSISLFILDYRIAIITLFLLTMPLYVPKLVEKSLHKAQKEYVEQFEQHIKTLTDWLNGFEIIKNFSIEKNITKRFVNSNNITMEKYLRKYQVGYLTRTVSTLLSYLSHFIILFFAAYLVLQGDFTAGDFFIAVGMIDQLSYPIISLSFFIQNLISVEPVNTSILEFINQKPKSHGTKEISKDDFKEVLFSNVTFGYKKNKTILNNLNMTFLRDKQYLLKGGSGSGKTTSMNLLLNYYQPISGTVKINDASVPDIKNINEIITVMRQDAVLFEDTLKNNIAMYREVPDERVISVLSKVGLAKYANSNSLKMVIQERGTNLSGGEKSRVTLARSLLRETPILILDEPLANLDENTAREIEKQLLSITDRTVIIISHTFSSENTEKVDKVIQF